ncbi:MAG: DinB family protein [Candidatus Aminicenantes bacterium]|jgi:uncharacterized damage-inducible protein DinB
MDDKAIRKDLIKLLRGGQAHLTLEKSLKGLKPGNRNVRPQTGIPSIYELLEHMRLAQEDILRYTLDQTWESPSFPDGYWPANNDDLTEKRWQETVANCFRDLDELITFVRETDLDLSSQIPHGEGRTYLREILLVADHNAYHLGQIVQVRKTLGNWND